jgi:hypothetical protein
MYKLWLAEIIKFKKNKNKFGTFQKKHSPLHQHKK